MCEIEISHMGKNNQNPDLVCENSLSNMDMHMMDYFSPTFQNIKVHQAANLYKSDENHFYTKNKPVCTYVSL